MAKARAQPSKRSRAARRATSPSIDTDKSLKTAQPPRSGKPTERPAVLAVQHAAGVQKKTSQRKAHVSAKARRRKERGAEMAEAVLERTAGKVRRSWDRLRVVDGRRQAWDAINKDVNGDEEEEEPAEKKNKKSKTQTREDKQDKEEGWETDENEEAKSVQLVQPVVDDGLDEIM
ncbi:hypothetical protein CCM_09423 [Cordyceps militaris CM01]|uniref:Ribosome biogenesis Alb1 n=1 Tax=Cordyceps militaris (strain CM01) TaxID=983644 RepID=G3JU94_CORMM|nr:uncharacterized protein CCM_09423 [Cordyceps militaris CM01]EGX87801.1 hypothetical protein CCM_09423 [Cordyceps militaris CM01]